MVLTCEPNGKPAADFQSLNSEKSEVGKSAHQTAQCSELKKNKS